MQANKTIAFNLPSDKELFEYVERIPTGEFSSLVRSLLKETNGYRLYMRTIRRGETVERGAAEVANAKH